MGEKGAKPDLDGSDLRIAVVVARFNEDITKRLLRGAQESLQQHGVEESDVYWVPGSLELPVTALALAEKGAHDAIVCLGCVIRGETFHFEVVAMQAASGIMQVQLDTGVPIAFGVLTTEDRDQALARSGPKNNKGGDAAETAIEMANLLREIQG
ncbi:MAG: 6,7-dimethyl-8-ribityllumazine synthase [Chloroflexi bacterium]|nr:MAG: 6,7-dimethyl-8-ribityllumazine synthase [Actinobacteria bacterium 13_2_20CM_2_66_6]TMB76301.1 MAG: 6,7-dimethyl-8-ribityllumazine synthase [Chloroflexota bacterium]TMF77505.1 MAG: 6,7-dimethyl-8-ribityllumazine synthase [Chloroflexota bacterium]TMF79463.1 MAG: 6,7-dimethyl-8-ribityllumazine synthase [Chloroflexota bacterium]